MKQDRLEDLRSRFFSNMNRVQTFPKTPLSQINNVQKNIRYSKVSDVGTKSGLEIEFKILRYLQKKSMYLDSKRLLLVWDYRNFSGPCWVLKKGEQQALPHVYD